MAAAHPANEHLKSQPMAKRFAWRTERITPIRILSVSPSIEDHRVLWQLAHGMGRRLATAGSCHTALRRLGRGGISIVICERDLPDGTWRCILDYLATATEKEKPLLIVTSKLADESLWAEVLNLGL
jgi:hypothetical protein